MDYQIIELRRRANANLAALRDGTAKRRAEAERETRAAIKRSAAALAVAKREEAKRCRREIKRLMARADEITRDWADLEADFGQHPGAMEELDHERDRCWEKAEKLRRKINAYY